MKLRYKFQPVQKKFYEKYEFGSATKLGFGGSRGGAKSSSADILMLIRRGKYPKTNGLFVMKVYQDMIDIHLTPLFQRYPELRNNFREKQMILTLPNGSYIRFLSGDSLKTFQERKGREFADIIIDQSELFTQDELEFLSTINRSTDLKITSKMMFCFNPGGVGHSYHKRLFYDKVYENREEPTDYDFVQTFGWDNAYLSQKPLAEDNLTIDDYHTWDDKKRFEYFITRSDYGKNLNRLRENKRKAELLGDMDIFEGMFFSDFRRDKHVLKNNIIVPNWNTIGGLDYGNTTCLEVLQTDYEGSVVVADECYLPDMESPGERANAIADFLLERRLFNLLIIYDTDMDISQLSNVGFDKTPIEIFRHVFKQRMGKDAPKLVVVNKTSLDKHKGYRAASNEAIKEYLHIQENGQPKVYFSEKVKHLIKELTEIIYDPSDPSGMDFLHSGTRKPHCIDSFKMALMNLYKSVKKEEVNLNLVPRPTAHPLIAGKLSDPSLRM